ncbi:MAG TPA: hypothetical protein VJ809_03365 [Pirellulales bacterium]|nr:hypothetical protein [Pirellulales bacterium]
MKPVVYLETTVVSYLAARPSRDLIVAGRQRITRSWWRTREDYEIVSSELAVQELTAGDPEWARRRLKLLETVPVVSMNDEAEQMALELVSRRIIPIKAKADAFLIAPSRNKRRRVSADLELQAFGKCDAPA